jgi:hypothetical protein
MAIRQPSGLEPPGPASFTVFAFFAFHAVAGTPIPIPLRRPPPGADLMG